MNNQQLRKAALTYLRQGKATAAVCAKQMFGGGLLSSLASQMVRLIRFIVFVLLWKGFAKAGVDLEGFTEASLLTYTLLSFVFAQQFDIISPATASLWEGSVIGRYTRPMPVYLSFISETVGRWWVPYFLLFSLPALLLAPLLGISPLPVTAVRGLLFGASLFLSVCIGFAIDLIFAAFAMGLKNAVWIVTQLRNAVFNLLSGALIPFSLFPSGVARVFSLLPFGSVANAPLTIYTGGGNPGRLLALQLFWAVALWLAAHFYYKKAEERMISYGG